LIDAATAHFMQKPIRRSIAHRCRRRRSMGFMVRQRRVLLIYCVGRDGIGLSNRLDERVKESQPFYLYSIIY